MFTAWLLVNGVWVHGSNFDGWYPIETTQEQCEEWLEFTTTYPHPDVKFTCEYYE